MGASYTPQSACSGQGNCAVSAPISCEPYVCDQPGAICYAACTADGGQCATDAYCGGLRCSLKKPPGQVCAATSSSTANDECISGICSANCCVTACPPDPAGYNCQGLCDTQGACIPKTCPNNFTCAGTIDCMTTCATNLQCVATTFCDSAGATTCCSRFTTGDTLYIDGAGGNDANACCGAKATPCQTLTHAMAMIANSATSGLILRVSNSDATTSWTLQEKYPIHLGWGVTVQASGIYFVNSAKATDVFQVYAYDITDTATVTLQGGGVDIVNDAIYIGFDPNTGVYSNSTAGVNDAVLGQTALPMVLSDIWFNSNGPGGAYDLMVGAGAAVTLGPGKVEMGNGTLINAPYNDSLLGDHGIYCKGAGAIIQDDPAAASPVLSIDTREVDFIDIEDGCTVSLTKGPRLGWVEAVPSFGWDGTLAGCGVPRCYSRCDYSPTAAVRLVGSGSITYGSIAMPGFVHCAQIGFDAETANQSGSPTVILAGASVDVNTFYHFCKMGKYCSDTLGTSCANVLMTEGTFSATSSTFSHAYMGVFLGSNVISADLSGGGNGGNTFGCNGNQYGTINNCTTTTDIPTSGGADVINATAALGVNAQNGIWDQYDSSAQATQVWSCSDTTYSDCTCSGANCPGTSGAPPDDADAVYLNTNTAAAPLDTTVGSQNPSGSCQ